MQDTLRPLTRILLFALLAYALDRLTKIWVVDWMDLANLYIIEVYPPFLTYRMAWNEGVNFGLLGFGGDSMRYVLIGLALVLVTGLLIWQRRAPGWLLPAATGLVVGGALGNVWDRVIFGAVADFLNVSCCGINNPFAFNLADAFIFIGVVGLIFWGDRGRAKSRATKPRTRSR
ncbi:MAG: signal peptidase II [Paracoccaceae bacterium]